MLAAADMGCGMAAIVVVINLVVILLLLQMDTLAIVKFAPCKVLIKFFHTSDTKRGVDSVWEKDKQIFLAFSQGAEGIFEGTVSILNT